MSRRLSHPGDYTHLYRYIYKALDGMIKEQIPIDHVLTRRQEKHLTRRMLVARELAKRLWEGEHESSMVYSLDRGRLWFVQEKEMIDLLAKLISHYSRGWWN